jgi:hypothetical protein
VRRLKPWRRRAYYRTAALVGLVALSAFLGGYEHGRLSTAPGGRDSGDVLSIRLEQRVIPAALRTGEGATPTPAPAIFVESYAPTERAAPPSGSISPPPAAADLLQAFSAGYLDAGGPPDLLDHFLYHVIPCESHWNPLDISDDGQIGLAQFDPGTWASYARPGADWRDPWEQGWATADLAGDLISRGESPGSSGGWPWCYW